MRTLSNAPTSIRSVFEILVQWMVRVERFGFQNHVQLQQTAALRIVADQKPQICGKQHAVRIAAGQSRLSEVGGCALLVVAIGDQQRQQPLLVADVVQQSGLAHADGVGDVLERRTVVPLLTNQPARRRDDFAFALFGRFTNPLFPLGNHMEQRTIGRALGRSRLEDVRMLRIARFVGEHAFESQELLPEFQRIAVWEACRPRACRFALASNTSSSRMPSK